VFKFSSLQLAQVPFTSVSRVQGAAFGRAFARKERASEIDNWDLVELRPPRLGVVQFGEVARASRL
jgi:hypothetical protein